MLAFASPEEVMLPRTVVKRINYPEKAYVYAVFAARRQVKIGMTSHPNWRIPFVCGFFRRIQQILVIGPTKQWELIERRLLRALKDFSTLRPTCRNVFYDHFRLPDEVRTQLYDCFRADCSDGAIAAVEARVAYYWRGNQLKPKPCPMCGRLFQ